MKPATTHDLFITSTIVVGCCLAVLILQIVIITKSTIPADAVITELRVFRNEVANDHNLFIQRLADIDSALDREITKQNTLRTLEASSALNTN